jgi:hypothetical protein
MPRHEPSRWRRSVVLVAACVVLPACASGPTITTATSPVATTVSATPPPDIPDGRSCSNPSPTSREKHGLEVQGVMRGGQPFYALFDGARRLATERPQLLYLRMPGARTLRITLVGPDDRLVRVSGLRPGLPPYPWDRPGDPWTGTLTFPQAGCWRIYVDRSGFDGELWVRFG